MHGWGSDVETEVILVGRTELEVVHGGRGPLVLLLHGFPEHAHSWRHQAGALVDAGYHVVVPNQRGYGNSARPEGAEHYTIHHLVGDAVGLCAHFGSDAPVVVGHDWGALVAWHLALLRPDLVRGVVGMSVPYVPRLDHSVLELIDLVRDGGFHYIRYFQEPGLAEAELESDVPRFLRAIFWSASGDRPGSMVRADPKRQHTMFAPEQVPDESPSWLTDDDLAVYAESFERSGFTPALNWYRNFHRNWELTAAWPQQRIRVPAGFVAGRDDPVITGGVPGHLTPAVTGLGDWCDDLRVVELIDGIGHWVQQEAPDATNHALLGFLDALER